MIYELSAVELAQLIRTRKLSAGETVQAFLDRIERVNPHVNALVTLAAERAISEAASADAALARGELSGPLHGVPVVHKDLHDTAGIRTTYGSPVFAGHVPVQDSAIVERVRSAGAIMLGKSNTPEFGAGSQTFNPVFGATRNPYDLSKTCGGSSGGSAVALACNMTPLADGTDMGGSLRNPAAFCNVAGLRPSPGRVPLWPTAAPWSPLNVAGPMARTVQDLALLLRAMSGPDPRCALAAPDLPDSELQRDWKGVRIAWYRDLNGTPFDVRVRSAVDTLRQTFIDIGCIVEIAEPDFSGADQIFRTFRAYEFYLWHRRLLPDRRAAIKQPVVDEIERGSQISAGDLAEAEDQRRGLLERMRKFFQQYDFFVLPVTQVPPFDINEPYVREIDGIALGSYIDWMRSCYYISVTTHPAVSVPAGFTQEGLPLGLQIVGPRWGDWAVLQLAYAFEQATGNHRRRPIFV